MQATQGPQHPSSAGHGVLPPVVRRAAERWAWGLPRGVQTGPHPSMPGREEERVQWKVPAHLLHGDGGRFGAWFLDLRGRVALLVPHGEDGGGMHHGQVWGQPAV